MADPWLEYSPTKAPTAAPPVDTGQATPKVDPWLAAPAGEQTAVLTPQAQLFATPENPIAAGARGILEGAKAPFDAAWETAKAILSDPDVGFLPAEEHQQSVDKAAELGVKGSTFWSGMLAGGGAANLGKGFLSKSVLGAAAGIGASKLAEITPAVVHQDLSPVEAAKEVGTATAYGALFGAAVGGVPGATKLGAKTVGGTVGLVKSGANKILDITPGGPQLREGASQFFRDHFAVNWDKFFTSGQELLKKVKLGGLATQLRMASSISALTGGRWNADFAKNAGWIGKIRLPGAMTDDEIRQASFLMIGRNMHDFATGTEPAIESGFVRLYRGQMGRFGPSTASSDKGRWFTTNRDAAKFYGDIHYVDIPKHVAEAAKQTGDLATGTMYTESGRFLPPEIANKAIPIQSATIQGFSQKAVNLAVSEARKLRAIGLRLQRAGVQVFDPESGNSHTFILRKDYGIPIRYNNPDAYRSGGEFREAAMAKIKQKLDMTDDRASEWLDGFSNRLQAEQEGIVSGAPISAGTNHFMMGRSLELPGYETDLRDILPQYYEYAARRLSNHLMFGPVSKVEDATRKAVQQELFAPEEIANKQFAAQTANPVDEQMFIEEFKNVRGRGIPQRTTQRKLTTAQIVRARQERAMKEVRREYGIEQRYPRAFSQLEQVEDPAYKDLATKIVRRQLGAIDRPTVGEGLWKAAAHAQVVTKLALGAIAQPSQMLSAITRTQYKGSIGNLFRTLGNDPEALDFALRSGVILRGIVRHSEQSLTGGSADFLEKVYFTQLDMKSRVFGALQGASFAEHQASQLYNLARQGTPAALSKAARIEVRLRNLGLDSQAIVARGGHLTQDELLRAGQKVSSDVNFWGDSMSLPEFFRSPAGRYLTMFKSFGFQQGKLFKDAIAKPAVEWLASDGKRGDIGPLTRFAVLTPAGGEIITDIKKFARGRDPRRLDRNLAERAIENIANGAGFGLAADAFEATKYGLSGTLGWAGGPITTEGGKLVTNVGAAARGNPRGLAKQVIETGLPVAAGIVAPRLQPAVAAVAPAISNILLPPKGKP